MFYFRCLNLGASYLLIFCDIAIKLIRKSACLYFLFLLLTYVSVLFLLMFACGKRTIKKNDNWNPQHLRNQTGWCLCCPRDVCWSPNDVLRGVESPHFSSIQPLSSLSVLHLSVFTITSLSCNHIDKLKLSSRSCFSIVSCGKGCGFHGIQLNGSFSGSATVGCSSARAREKKRICV